MLDTKAFNRPERRMRVSEKTVVLGGDVEVGSFTHDDEVRLCAKKIEAEIEAHALMKPVKPEFFTVVNRRYLESELPVGVDIEYKAQTPDGGHVWIAKMLFGEGNVWIATVIDTPGVMVV